MISFRISYVFLRFNSVLLDNASGFPNVSSKNANILKVSII